MFTNRFIKIPVNLYDLKKAEIIGFNEETNEGGTYVKVDPYRISHYRPAVDDNADLKETFIHLENGESFQSSASIERVERILNDFFEPKEEYYPSRKAVNSFTWNSAIIAATEIVKAASSDDRELVDEIIKNLNKVLVDGEK